MKILANREEILEQANRTHLRFLKIELGVARTYSQMALQTRHPGTRAEHRSRARKAYDTVMRFKDRPTMSSLD